MSDQPQPAVPDFTASNPVFSGPPPEMAVDGAPAPSQPVVPVSAPAQASTPPVQATGSHDVELGSNQTQLKSGRIVTLRETNGADDNDLEAALTQAGYTVAGVGAAEYGNMLALCAITELDGAAMALPTNEDEFHAREDMFLSSDIARIVLLYNKLNLDFDRSKINAKERTCTTHLGRTVVVMETTGGHDRRVNKALTEAGYSVGGVNTMTYLRMSALCAIDTVNGKTYTRPRTRTDLRERAADFLSKECQMIMALYQEVNMIGATF